MNYNLERLKFPYPFEPGNLTLWNNEYIAQNVIKKHLNSNENSGSRNVFVINKTIKWIKKNACEGKSILDVGCGPGLYAPQLCEVGFNYEGFDVSPYQIAYAKKYNCMKGAKYYVADLRAWDSEKRYDVVLMLYGIYSFYCPSERVDFLKKIKCKLKKGGYLALEVFTAKHYAERENSTDWEFVEREGFWSGEPYLELNTFRKYSNGRLVLIQAAVLNETLKVWNSWIQVFDSETLKAELSEVGFKRVEIYGNCFGEKYTSESEMLCIKAQ